VRLTLATWNINSVRLRLPLVLYFLQQYQPDVLCLQETKCPDGVFPVSELRKLGYPYLALNGQKGYHGVAILSRLPFAEEQRREFCGKGDARHLCVTLAPEAGAAHGVAVHNFYVPAGGDDPDPLTNPKFAHKLAFLDEMSEWFARDKVAAGPSVLVGDLNIAPFEEDVWNHKALLSVVSHTPVEVDRLGRVLAAGPWSDAMRRLVPQTQKLYTWWSYRSPNWAAVDKGRRLDHVWLSPSLASALRSMKVVREARGWERPSDHVPVIVDLEI
jgi:exodeoxyribonuclease-3